MNCEVCHSFLHSTKKHNNKWEIIIRLKAEIQKNNDLIETIKPQAVIELKNLGYSYDRIQKLIGVAKVTAIRIIKKKERGVFK